MTMLQNDRIRQPWPLSSANDQNVVMLELLPDLLSSTAAHSQPEALLNYFRRRRYVHYLPLKPGKAKHAAAAEKILHNEFNFNNELHVLPDDFDWLHNPSHDLEWLILLHKFYYSRDLALAYDYSGDERYAQKWVSLVESWIRQVPANHINSQVTGRRLQQWLLAYHYFVPKHDCKAITPDFLSRLLASIAEQANLLKTNLTPEGNHRTIELYAIFSVAVLFPELPDANELLAFSKRELLLNLSQDFLADGVQKELSTDYHHTVLKNFLRVRELAELNGIRFPSEFDALLQKALDFSVYAHKPDGWLPAINDGDINSYLSMLHKAHSYFPSDALLFTASQGEEGQPPSQRCKLFKQSGYCILRSDWSEQPYRDGRYLIFDAGPLGFGSHGHYDLLSFEAAAFGRSLIVDPGRFTYHDKTVEGVNWRHLFKGTAAHNTVMVDGKDQINFSGEKPAGPEPKAQVLEFVSQDGFDYVQGLAQSPQYPAKHYRSIFFIEQEYWLISDRLSSEQSHHYRLLFHLPPEALHKTEFLNQAYAFGFNSPNLCLLQPRTPGISATQEQGYFSPEYGIKQAAPVLRFEQEAAGLACFHTLLYPYKTTAPQICIARLRVTDCLGNDATQRAQAIRIEFYKNGTSFRDTLFMADNADRQAYRYEQIRCQAQVVFTRQTADGNFLSIQAMGLRSLIVDEVTVVNGLPNDLSLCYTQGKLSLICENQNWHGPLDSIADLPSVLAYFKRELEAGA